MSYKLEYPYTEDERIKFIHSYRPKYRVEIVDNFIEEERTQEITEEREVLDEEGNVTGTETVVVDTETYYEAVNYPTYYALEANEIMEGGEPVINPNYEAEQEQKERERIARLKLTKREVFLGLYQAKGVTPDMIKAQITDPQALIEFEYANDYYRGNPLIDIVGGALGIEPAQLDCFFETNDYTCLLPTVSEMEIIEEPVVDNSEGTAEENSVVTETEVDEV